MAIGCPLCFDQLTAVEIRAPDVADLSRSDEAVERGHALLDRRVVVPVVQLVEVDVVRTQPTQTGLEGTGQVDTG